MQVSSPGLLIRTGRNFCVLPGLGLEPMITSKGTRLRIVEFSLRLSWQEREKENSRRHLTTHVTIIMRGSIGVIMDSADTHRGDCCNWPWFRERDVEGVLVHDAQFWGSKKGADDIAGFRLEPCYLPSARHSSLIDRRFNPAGPRVPFFLTFSLSRFDFYEQTLWIMTDLHRAGANWRSGLNSLPRIEEQATDEKIEGWTRGAANPLKLESFYCRSGVAKCCHL